MQSDILEDQMARIIEVIETWERRGLGTGKDPVRTIYQLWTKEGVLIHEEKDKYGPK